MTCKAMGKLVNILSCLLLAAIIITSVWNVTMVVEAAVIDIISTVAGNGVAGNAGDGGLATNAQLRNPYGVAVDDDGNIYITDYYNHRIRKVDTGGTITRVVGTTQGYSGDGGLATSAKINRPRGIAVDGGGNIYFADTDNNRIRMVPASNGTYFGIAMTAENIYTIAGNGTPVGYSGDGGLATDAQLNYPRGVAVDSAGNLYIADRNNRRIRMVPATDETYFGVDMTAGYIYTVAGNGNNGTTGDGGPATSATLGFANGVAVDGGGNIYIVDNYNHRIRKVDTGGTITTVAGTSRGYSGDGGPATAAKLDYPEDVTVDGAGNLYISDTGNQRIRKVHASSSIITTVAGTGVGDYSGDGGPATEAQIRGPMGVEFYGENELYFADYTNNVIRMVEFNGAILPVWASGYPKAGVVGLDSIEILVQTDEDGAAYFVALPTGAPAPSSTQVKNGQNASGSSVANNLKGTVAVTANIEASFSATSLTDNTTYDIYVVAESYAMDLQPVPAKITVKTQKEPWRSSESCADCHGITAEDFAPAPIDRNTVCAECHRPEPFEWPYVWGEEGMHPHNAVPLWQSKLNASPGVLHLGHSTVTTSFGETCYACHGVVSCSACHQDVPHWDHGSSQITPLELETGDGTAYDWEYFSCGVSDCHKTIDQIQPGSCTTTCHTVGKDGHTDSPRTHGDFSASTSACAGCHVAHAAPGPKLMLQPTQTELCFLCHGAGAVGSPYDVQSGLTWNPVAGETGEWQLSSAGGYSWLGQNATTSIHAIEGYGANQALYDPTQPGFIGTIPGGSLSLDGRGLQCSSCHQPHGGSGNARLLRNNFGGENIQLRMTTGANMVISYDHGFSEWCEACHGRFNVGSHAGHIGEDFNGVTYFRHPMNVQVDNPDINQSFNRTPLQTGKRTSDSTDDNLVVCVTCHRAHGTAATTDGYALTWPKDTGTTGEGSALLRMNNRGVCFNCHGSP